MLSRVADSFYWMRRYLERAEHSARVLDVHLSLSLDDPTDAVGRTLLSAVGETPIDVGIQAAEAAATEATGRIDPAHRKAVVGFVVAARENARQIREHISSDMWEQVNSLYLTLRHGTTGEDADSPAFLRSVIEGTHLFHGIAEATLSHGEGWHFMQLGRYIERATTTATMLADYFSERGVTPLDVRAAGEYVEWVGLLRACAAFEAYCRAHTADVQPQRLTEFLLLNAECPRSVRFAADRIEDSLRAIARGLGRQATGRPERFAGRLRAALNFGTIDEILDDSLMRYVESIRQQCDQIHAALNQTYISYTIETAIAR
jgi:uncharacterized alpha-E superfamily protein